MKGDEFVRQEKYEEALDCYLNATDIDPEFAPAWHNMGIICELLGQNDEADACFEKERMAIRKSAAGGFYTIPSELLEDRIVDEQKQPPPVDPEELYLRGISQSQNGQLDEAISTFDQVIMLNPSDCRVWNSRGIALAKVGRYQEADKAFNQALIIDPSYQPAINNQNKVRNILMVPEQAAQNQSPESSKIPESSIRSSVPAKKTLCPECRAELSPQETEICLTCGAGIHGSPLETDEKSPVTGESRPVTGETRLVTGMKSPGIAALLSFIFPGLGQVYNGYFTRGFLFLIGTFVGMVLLIIPGVIVWVYQIYDAYSTAKKMNAGAIPFKETNTVHVILYIVLFFVVIAIFIMMAAIIAAFLYGMTGTAGMPSYYP